MVKGVAYLICHTPNHTTLNFWESLWEGRQDSVMYISRRFCSQGRGGGGVHQQNKVVHGLGAVNVVWCVLDWSLISTRHTDQVIAH